MPRSISREAEEEVQDFVLRQWCRDAGWPRLHQVSIIRLVPNDAESGRVGEESLLTAAPVPRWRLAFIFASAVGSSVRSACLEVIGNWVFLVFWSPKGRYIGRFLEALDVQMTPAAVQVGCLSTLCVWRLFYRLLLHYSSSRCLHVYMYYMLINALQWHVYFGLS